MDELERRLGLRLTDRALFLQALTHSSYAHERGSGRFPSNERLEFLGDGVVNLAAAHFVWERLPDEPEGGLTRRRTALVNEQALARRAMALGLDRLVLLGAGEERSGGRRRPSLLCDVFEAVAGAIYLTAGWRKAYEFLRSQFEAEWERRVGSGETEGDEALWADAKSRLQEYVQSLGEPLPRYRLVAEEGPPHRRRFTVEVEWRGRVWGRGEGSSRRRAEQRAAAVALEKLLGPGEGDSGAEGDSSP